MNMPQIEVPSLASQLKLDAHWMPFSANRNFKRDPRLIVGADGNHFIDDKGRRVFDSLSGLWTCGAGHNRKEIQEAVAKQLGTLDYAPGFQYGHPLSYQLAEKITELTPAGLDHVFYTDSGSECADTSVKMAKAYWRLKGQASKTRFIGRARGYHGVNIAGTSLAEPAMYHAYREMTIPAGPEWVEEHIRRLSEKGIQTHFQLANITQLETVERMMRRGVCNVPLILTWVAIGGGFDQPNIYNLANFVRGCPDGSVLTLESSMLNVLPINMMGMAMGLHVRCGIEDNIWTQDRSRKMTTVEQIEQLVRIAKEFGRPVANGKEAREIYRIGVQYDSVEQTLLANGMAPNRKAGQKGVPQRG